MNNIAVVKKGIDLVADSLLPQSDNCHILLQLSIVYLYNAKYIHEPTDTEI